MGVHKPYPLAGDAMLFRRKPADGAVAVIGSKVYDKSNNRLRFYKNPIGIDMLAGDGVDIVHNLENPLEGYKFSHIDCCSVLEHARKPWLVAESIEGIMREGATILVTVPFMWRVHAYPSDYWRFTLESLEVLFPNINWIERDYYNAQGKVKKPPTMTVDGAVWFEKTEIAAWGIK